jgi:hypothetical protein
VPPSAYIAASPRRLHSARIGRLTDTLFEGSSATGDDSEAPRNGLARRARAVTPHIGERGFALSKGAQRKIDACITMVIALARVTAPPFECFDVSLAVLVQTNGRGLSFPVLDPVADVGFQGLDAGVDSALEQFGGQLGEPAFVG